MAPTTSPQRIAVCAAALTWVGTPWHHGAAVKGAGVDCAQLLRAIFVGQGIVPSFPLPSYPRDWMLHRDEERFRAIVAEHCDQVAAPLPADIALWHYFRCFSHGGIVLGWPRVVHAHLPERRVVIGNASERPLAGRPVEFWRPRGLA